MQTLWKRDFASGVTAHATLSRRYPHSRDTSRCLSATASFEDSFRFRFTAEMGLMRFRRGFSDKASGRRVSAMFRRRLMRGIFDTRRRCRPRGMMRRESPTARFISDHAAPPPSSPADFRQFLRLRLHKRSYEGRGLKRRFRRQGAPRVGEGRFRGEGRCRRRARWIFLSY